MLEPGTGVLIEEVLRGTPRGRLRELAVSFARVQAKAWAGWLTGLQLEPAITEAQVAESIDASDIKARTDRLAEADGKSVIYFALRRNKGRHVLGFIKGKAETVDGALHTTISETDTDPRAQRRGIATLAWMALVTRFMVLAAKTEHGVAGATVDLRVLRKNESAMAWYERMGFVETEGPHEPFEIGPHSLEHPEMTVALGVLATNLGLLIDDETD